MVDSANQLLSRIEVAIINPVIALLFGVALVVFLWGCFEFVRDAASPDGRSTGGRHILWGSIGMGIMLSVYGIMNLILNSVNHL